MKSNAPPYRRKLSSVRNRLTLWNIMALAVALTLVGLQIRYRVQANILASIDHELSVRSRRPPGRGFNGSNRGGDRQGSSGSFGSFGSSSPGRGAQRDGNQTVWRTRLLTLPETPPLPSYPGTKPAAETPWDPAAYDRAVKGEEVYSTIVVNDESARVFSRPVRFQEEIVGVAQTPLPLTEMERAIGSLDHTLLTTIPLILLIAGIGGAFMTGRVLRPVRQITRSAEQIGAEDLAQRLPVVSEDEFGHLASTFNAMLTRLEGSFTQQRRFTSDASHELKTPLTVIKANTSLALRMPRTPEEYTRRLEAIDRATDSMSRLVNDLLLLARSDEGREEATWERLALSALLEEAAEAVRRPGVAPISIVSPPIPIFVEGDRRDLGRVFSNLLDNAVRHTPAEGQITVTVVDEHEAVVIRIEDTGEGIADEHLAHLGERFYRVDSARARVHGGTGLGLSICRSILGVHRGTMTIHSVVNQGTTVQVTLPTAIEA